MINARTAGQCDTESLYFELLPCAEHCICETFEWAVIINGIQIDNLQHTSQKSSWKKGSNSTMKKTENVINVNFIKLKKEFKLYIKAYIYHWRVLQGIGIQKISGKYFK